MANVKGEQPGPLNFDKKRVESPVCSTRLLGDFMKISKKTRLKILNTIAASTIETILDQYPDYEQWGPPDMWDRDAKQIIDVIYLLEAKVEANVNRILMA